MVAIAMRGRAGSSFVVALCFVMMSITGITLMTIYVRSSVKTTERLPLVYDNKHIFNTATARAITLLQTKSDTVPAEGAQCTISTAAPYAVIQFNTAGAGKWTIQVTTQAAWGGCRCAKDFQTQLCR